MKKWMIIGIVVMMAVLAAGCASTSVTQAAPTVLYKAGGAFSNWGEYDPAFMFTPVQKNDSRLAPLASALANAREVYLYEHTVGPDEGWTGSWTGGVPFEGSLIFKAIKWIPEPEAEDGWAIQFWAPSPESGAVANLTPDTLAMPLWRPDDVRDAAADGLGGWNEDPYLKTKGTYYMVFAIMNDGSQALGAVKK